VAWQLSEAAQSIAQVEPAAHAPAKLPAASASNTIGWPDPVSWQSVPAAQPSGSTPAGR
jgi:hypothetical protein